MNLLALIFALFFALMAIGFALLCRMRKSWNPVTYLSLGYMILAAAVFLVTAFVKGFEIKLVVLLVLAAAVFLWAVVDLVKKIRSSAFRLYHVFLTLIYLFLTVLVVLRAFGVHFVLR